MVTERATLLTVMAHPDDAELWAGGTIAEHTQAGGTAIIAVTKHDPVRTAGAGAGARILGAHLYLLEAITAHAIGTVLAEVRPAIVITHSTDDVYPEHRHCAEHVLSAPPVNMPPPFTTTATCRRCREPCLGRHQPSGRRPRRPERGSHLDAGR